MDNNSPWSLLLSAIEMTSKCSKFKWNHKPQANGFTAWSFLCSKRAQTMESCRWFVFYNNIESFDIHFHWSFSENCSCEKEKNCWFAHDVRSAMLIGGQEQKHFCLLGTKLYFHVNSSRKNSVLLTPNMAALSCGCTPRITPPSHHFRVCTLIEHTSWTISVREIA